MSDTPTDEYDPNESDEPVAEASDKLDEVVDLDATDHERTLPMGGDILDVGDDPTPTVDDLMETPSTGFASKRSSRSAEQSRDIDVSRPTESLPTGVDADELMHLKSEAESYAERAARDPGSVAAEIHRIKTLLTEPISDVETEAGLARRAAAAKALGRIAAGHAVRIVDGDLVATVEELLEEEYRRGRRIGSSAAVGGKWTASAKTQEWLAKTLASLAATEPEAVAATSDTVEKLLTVNDPGVREAAIRALSSIAETDAGETDAVATQLGHGLQDGEGRVALTAAKRLGRIGIESPDAIADAAGDIRSLFTHESPELRSHGARLTALLLRAGLGDAFEGKVVAELSGLLTGDDSESGTMTNRGALGGLTAIAESDADSVVTAVDGLGGCLTHDDDIVRRQTSGLLLVLTNERPDALPDLVSPADLAAVCDDEDDTVVGRVSHTLTLAYQSRSGDAIPPTLGALLTHEDENVRLLGIRALRGTLPDDVERVVALWFDDDPLVVVGAVAAVGAALVDDDVEAERIVDGLAIDRLVDLLGHDNPKVRDQAMSVVFNVGKTHMERVARGDVVANLVDELTGSDDMLRDKAVRTLQRVVSHDTGILVDSDAVEASDVVDAVLESEAIRTSVEGDHDKAVRASAGYVLAGAVREDEAVRPRVVDAVTENSMVRVGVGDAVVNYPDLHETLLFHLIDANDDALRLGGLETCRYSVEEATEPDPDRVERHVTPAIDLLSSEDRDVSETAAETLIRLSLSVPEVFSASDVTALADALGDDAGSGIRTPILRAISLVAVEEPGTVVGADVDDSLVDAFDHDDDEVQWLAVRGFRGLVTDAPDRVADDDAVSDLVALQRHQSANVRAESARALATLAGTEFDVVDRIDVDSLIDLISHGDDGVENTAGNALGTLARHDPAAREAIGDLCTADEDRLQYHAAGMLQLLADRDPDLFASITTIDDFAPLLGHESSDVRGMAVVAVSVLGVSEQSSRSLLTGLLSHPEESVRLAAVRGVTERARTDAATREYLLDHVDDDDPQLRQSAIGSVGELAADEAELVVDSGAVQPLVDLLDSDHDSDRGLAIGALDRVAADEPAAVVEADGIEAIRRLLVDDRSEVRGPALETLYKLATANTDFVRRVGGLEALVDNLDRYDGEEHHGVMMILAVVASGSPEAVVDAGAVEPLFDRLEHDDEGVREGAVGALDELVGEETKAVVAAADVDELFDRLTEGDDAVRRLAVRVLGAAAPDAPAVVERLGELLDGDADRVVEVAARQLTKIGMERPGLLAEAETLDHVVGLLDHRSRDRREWGVILLLAIAKANPEAVRSVVDADTLVGLLGHETEEARKAAARTLGALGRDDDDVRAAVGSALADRLGASGGERHGEAAVLLRGVAATEPSLVTENVTPAEFHTLLDDDDGAVRSQMYGSLIELCESADSRAFVRELLDHEDDGRRQGIGRAMATAAVDDDEARGLFVDVLGDGDDRTARAVIRGAVEGAGTDESLRSLLADLVAADDPQVAARAMEAWRDVAEEESAVVARADALKPVVDRLDTGSEMLVAPAAEVVGLVAAEAADRLVSMGAVEPISALLDHDDPAVRSSAGMAVESLATAAPEAVVETGAIEHLDPLLAGEDDRIQLAGARIVAALALEDADHVAGGCSRDTLVGLLDHDEANVRGAAGIGVAFAARADPTVLDAADSVESRDLRPDIATAMDESADAPAVGALVSLLTHDDAATRTAGAQLLMYVSEEVGVLGWLLTHADRTVRASVADAVTTLVEAEDDESVFGPTDFASVVTHDDAAVRSAAVQALARAADDDPDLVAALTARGVDELEPPARRTAGRALTTEGTGSGRGIEALVDGATIRPDDEVRLAVTQGVAAAATTEPEARAFLGGLLGSDRDRIRELAAKVLADHEPAVIRDTVSVGTVAGNLTHDDEDIREPTVAAVGAVAGDPGSRSLLAGLLTHEEATVRETTEQVVAASADSDPAVRSFVVDALDDEDERLRFHAVQAAGYLATETPAKLVEAGAVDDLVALFDHEDEEMQAAASNTLSLLADEGHVTTDDVDGVDIEERLKHPNDDVQAAMGRIVTADLETPTGRETVVDLLNHDDESVQEIVGGTLFGRAPEQSEAMAFLTDHLDDDRDRVQYHAAGILRELAENDADILVEADAIEPLSELLDHEDDEVSGRALGALSRALDERPEASVDAVPIEGLVERLGREEDAARLTVCSACATLAEHVPERLIRAGAVAPVVDLLVHESVDVRQLVVVTLNNLVSHDPGAVAETRPVPTLRDLLTHEDETLQRGAGSVIARLATVDDRAREVLTDCVDADDDRLQYHGAGMVSVVGLESPELVCDLIPPAEFATLLGHEDDDIRDVAGQTIRNLDANEPAVKELYTALLTHEREEVRSHIGGFIAGLDEPTEAQVAILVDLLARDDEARTVAIETLSMLAAEDGTLPNGADAVSELAELLTDDDESIQTKAGEALGRLAVDEPAAREVLADCLADDDDRSQYHGAGMIGVISSESASVACDLVSPDDFAALLGHEDESVRRVTTNSLSKLDWDMSETVRIGEQLLKHDDESVRERAMSAMAEAWPEAEAYPTELLAHGNEDIQRRVTRVLLDIATDRTDAVTCLVGLLGAENRSKRYHATGAVSMLSRDEPAAVVDAGAVDALVDQLGDYDPEIRRVTLDAIRKLVEDHVDALVDAGVAEPLVDTLTSATGSVRERGAGTVAELAKARPQAVIDAGGVDPLVTLLTTVEDDDTRVAALGSLVRLGGEDHAELSDDDTVETLVAQLDDENHHIRGMAASALAMIAAEEPRAVVDAGGLDPLIDLLDDDELQQPVVPCLDRLAAGVPEAVVDAGGLDPLVSLLGTDDDELCQAAGRALLPLVQEWAEEVASTDIGERLPGILASDNAEVRNIGVYLLTAIVDAGEGSLLIDSAVVRRLQHALDGESERQTLRLINVASHNEPSMVIEADLVEPLVDRLDDEEEWFRRTAADALGPLVREDQTVVGPDRAERIARLLSDAVEEYVDQPADGSEYLSEIPGLEALAGVVVDGHGRAAPPATVLLSCLEYDALETKRFAAELLRFRVGTGDDEATVRRNAGTLREALRAHPEDTELRTAGLATLRQLGSDVPTVGLD